MRIRKNSEFAKHYVKELVCPLNQNPWDILDPRFPSQSQIDEENDDFCGLTSFGMTVKDLLSEIEEEKDKRTNEAPVYCSFTDASGFNCGVEAKFGSQYCEVHVQIPKKSTSTNSGTRGKRSAKEVNTWLKRKRDDPSSSTGGEILYYAGFPGLRRKRGRPPLRSRAVGANNVGKSQ